MTFGYNRETPAAILLEKRDAVLRTMSNDALIVPSTHATEPRGFARSAIVSDYGFALQFATRVEGEARSYNVPQIDTLIGADLDGPEAEFLGVWDDQEDGHYQTLSSILEHVGIREAPKDDTVQVKLRVLGALARTLPTEQLSRMVKYTYFCIGATNEAATDTNYLRLANGFRRLGEKDIARTILGIRRQEPLHQAFYKMSAYITGQQMPLWTKRLVAATQSRHFTMVGAKNKQHKIALGATIADIVDRGKGVEEDLEEMSERVFRVAHQVLYEHGQGLNVPNFVLKALKECYELYRSARSNGKLTTEHLLIPPATRQLPQSVESL